MLIFINYFWEGCFVIFEDSASMEFAVLCFNHIDSFPSSFLLIFSFLCFLLLVCCIGYAVPTDENKNPENKIL